MLLYSKYVLDRENYVFLCNDSASALRPGDCVLRAGHNSWLYVFIIKICDTGILHRSVITEIIPCNIPLTMKSKGDPVIRGYSTQICGGR